MENTTVTFTAPRSWEVVVDDHQFSDTEIENYGREYNAHAREIDSAEENDYAEYIGRAENGALLYSPEVGSFRVTKVEIYGVRHFMVDVETVTFDGMGNPQRAWKYAAHLPGRFSWVWIDWILVNFIL